MKKDTPYLIGLCGGTASGKTLLVNELMETHPKTDVSVISMDNYYLSINEQKRDENGYINFDLPDAIDINAFIDDVKKLLNGQSINRLEYNFNNQAIKPKKIEVKPAKVVILEGIFIFSLNELTEMMDYKVFLQVDEQLRLERKIKRDMEQRDMNMEWIMYQWENHTCPGYNNYIAPYINKADLVLDNSINITDSYAKLQQHIIKLVSNV